jgi:peptidoglycan/xylan/chitin deacetylase (PgdA/CDA1 family)
MIRYLGLLKGLFFLAALFDGNIRSKACQGKVEYAKYMQPEQAFLRKTLINEVIYMKSSKYLYSTILTLTLLAGCSSPVNISNHSDQQSADKSSLTPVQESPSSHKLPISPDAELLKSVPYPVQDLAAEMESRFKDKHPTQWGEHVSGVKRRINTQDRVIALTFDACGGNGGDGYDEALILGLRKLHIPATLFLNSRWIEANPRVAMELVEDSLFEVENHGTLHKPLSIMGKSAYGIQGTNSIRDVVHEVDGNAQIIEKLTGKKPHFFRAGTAYYDEVAVKIIESLGEEAVNFDVLGDTGATFDKSQVHRALLSSKPGSIVILHMNQPNKDTAEGVISAIPELQAKGFRFVKLEQYALKE